MNEAYQRREFFDIKNTSVANQKNKLYIKTRRVMKLKRFLKILLNTTGLMSGAAIVSYGVAQALIHYPMETVVVTFVSCIVGVTIIKYNKSKD